MRAREFVNDPTSPARKRALVLARAAEQLHAKLLKVRRLQGMTQKQVADTLGVTQPTIAAFERYDNDPKMSSILNYAHAVGATLTIGVQVEGVEVDLHRSPGGLRDGAPAPAMASQPRPARHQGAQGVRP